MITEIVEMLISLSETMSVVIVLSYLLTRTKLYDEILNKKLKTDTQIKLIIIFGFFAIFGTISGIEFMGAIANIRDLGPAIGGLLGGPVVGFGAGLIGAVHRFPLGGLTAAPCALATIFAGVAGGFINRYLKGEFLSIQGAVIFAVLIEIFHMGLVLLISRPFVEALMVVRQISIPMITANAIGMGIFAFIFFNVAKERRTAEDKKKMESELQIAREIQMSIVPKIFPAFPDRDDLNLHAVLEPAREVGGDLFDFYLTDNEKRLHFAVGDVSGKGIPASLFMAVTKTLLKAKATVGMSSNQTLSQVNDELCQGNNSAMFVTVFQGSLDLSSGEVEYTNGGHNLPYIIRADGSLEAIDSSRNIALGVMEEMPYEGGQFKLDSGDKLVIFTDGVTEAQDINGALFGETRLENHLQKNSDAEPSKLIELLMKEIDKFAAGAIQADDITILVIEYIQKDEKYKIVLKNDMSEITRLSKTLKEYAKLNNLNDKTFFNVNLVLEEIITNIISYGYQEKGKEEEIEVTLDLQNENLNITVKDNASPFNPLELPKPDIEKPVEEREIGGLGVHLVKEMTDYQEYRRECNSNILSLTKNINEDNIDG